MEPLGLSSGAAGFISLGISVCQGLLDCYRSWKDADDQVAHMYGSIEALTETFSLLLHAVNKALLPRNVAFLPALHARFLIRVNGQQEIHVVA